MLRPLDLKTGDPEFKSCSDHQLDLFQDLFGSTPRLHLYIANFFTRFNNQLGLLNLLFSSLFHWLGKPQWGEGN